MTYDDEVSLAASYAKTLKKFNDSDQKTHWSIRWKTSESAYTTLPLRSITAEADGPFVIIRYGAETWIIRAENIDCTSNSELK